jgi:hypothetical protein
MSARLSWVSMYEISMFSDSYSLRTKWNLISMCFVHVVVLVLVASARDA